MFLNSSISSITCFLSEDLSGFISDATITSINLSISENLDMYYVDSQITSSVNNSLDEGSNYLFSGCTLTASVNNFTTTSCKLKFDNCTITASVTNFLFNDGDLILHNSSVTGSVNNIAGKYNLIEIYGTNFVTGSINFLFSFVTLYMRFGSLTAGATCIIINGHYLTILESTSNKVTKISELEKGWINQYKT